MRAQIVAVLSSRACYLAPIMVGNMNDDASHTDVQGDEIMEGDEVDVYRMEVTNGRKSLPNPSVISGKGDPKG